jgi:hypothetical protein
MYSKVHIGKHLSDELPFQNGLNQADALLPFLFNSALRYTNTEIQELYMDDQINEN